MVVLLSAPNITPSLKLMAMLRDRQRSWWSWAKGTNIEVPRLNAMSAAFAYKGFTCNILDFALLEVVHVDVDAICASVSFELRSCGGNLPSPSMPVDIMMALLTV